MLPSVCALSTWSHLSWCIIHSCVLGARLQKGPVAEEYGGIILLLRLRLLVANSGKQHLTAADVNSDKVGRQCCAVDLLDIVAAISCAKQAVGTRHGT